MTFYFSYLGNKRLEIKHYQNLLLNPEITTFIEPFCGSCSTSKFVFENNPNVTNIILNDNDKMLMTFLTEIKNNGCKKFFDDYMIKL